MVTHLVLKWLRNNLLARIAFANSPAISAVECPLSSAFLLTLSIVPFELVNPLTFSEISLGIQAFVHSCTNALASIAIGIISLELHVSPSMTIFRPGMSSGGGERIVPSGRLMVWRSLTIFFMSERGNRMPWVWRCAALRSRAVM